MATAGKNMGVSASKSLTGSMPGGRNKGGKLKDPQTGTGLPSDQYFAPGEYGIFIDMGTGNTYLAFNYEGVIKSTLMM